MQNDPGDLIQQNKMGKACRQNGRNAFKILTGIPKEITSRKGQEQMGGQCYNGSKRNRCQRKEFGSFGSEQGVLWSPCECDI